MKIKSLSIECKGIEAIAWARDKIKVELSCVDHDEIIGEIENELSVFDILDCFEPVQVLAWLIGKGYEVKENEV